MYGALHYTPLLFSLPAPYTRDSCLSGVVLAFTYQPWFEVVSEHEISSVELERVLPGKTASERVHYRARGRREKGGGRVCSERERWEMWRLRGKGGGCKPFFPPQCPERPSWNMWGRVSFLDRWPHPILHPVLDTSCTEYNTHTPTRWGIL